MSSFAKSMGVMSDMLGMGRSAVGLPPLPGGLGLPERSNVNSLAHAKGEVDTQNSSFKKQYAKAEAYNKAFSDLLNQQPQLSGAERLQIYDVYSDKFVGAGGKGRNQGYIPPLTDYRQSLSQAGPMTREQIAAQQQQQQQQQQAAPTPMPTPVPAPAPQTVGPTPKPTVVQPPPTPTVATPAGNIAGKTTTTGVMGTDAGGRGSGRKRGRVATLLTGLGGAAEQFGA